MSDHQAIVASMGILMPVLSSLAVAARLGSRRIQHATLGFDDWFILAALVMTIGAGIDIVCDAYIGKIGVHLLDEHGKLNISPANFSAQAKIAWVLALMTTFAVGFTKISVLMLYRRIFLPRGVMTSSAFRILLCTMVAICGAWTVGTFFANLLACLPISATWQVSESGAYSTKAKCVNLTAMWFATAITDVVTDALILTLPWLPMSKMQLPLRKKIAVCAMFLLGGFTVVAGILKNVSFHRTLSSKSQDISYVQAPALYWTVIEAGVGVVSACLPCLSPLMERSGVWPVISRLRSAWSTSRQSAGSQESRHGYRISRHGGSLSHVALSAPEATDFDSVALPAPPLLPQHEKKAGRVYELKPIKFTQGPQTEQRNYQG